jgi:hypothetical protein
LGPDSRALFVSLGGTMVFMGQLYEMIFAYMTLAVEFDLLTNFNVHSPSWHLMDVVCLPEVVSCTVLGLED